ncbi:MAG: pyridoxal-phosphate dependent enzyme [Verrucomicrobiae bacterium]|nr:pyridoxal-phosphate dependent enzyme [Verrucomicrobiae bacterium]
MRLNLSRIEQAKRSLSPAFSDTPQYVCLALSRELDCEVTLKIETCNPIRCFKGRGAEIAIRRAIEEGHRSFVCASAGNLGQGVAFCSRRSGFPAVVVAARAAERSKLHRIAEIGAELILVDGDIEIARRRAIEIAAGRGSYLIEDSENIGTCEGAGTIALELLVEPEKQLDGVLVALGGGAMATGIGAVFKARSPETKVVCVQPKGAPAMTLSLRAGEVVTTESTETIADGVAGRFPIAEVLWDLQEVVDDALLVREESIVEAMRLLYRHSGLIVEPSAALGIAAVLENPDIFRGKKIATIICGANLAIRKFENWVHGKNGIGQ